MTESVRQLLLFTAVFSVAVLALAALRPWLRRRAGALSVYGAWLLIPAALLPLALPAPRFTLTQVEAVLLASDAPFTPSSPLDTQRHGASLLNVWCAGAAMLGMAMVLAQLRYRRQLQRRGTLWRSPAHSAVAIVGCWPSRLVLPSDFRQRYDRIERRLVLAHERVHLQRGDNAWTLLALALLAAQWFNPLAWWALRRYRTDQEIACDAAVMERHPQLRQRYVRALAKSAVLPGLLLASPCSTHPLIERINMLSQPPRPLRRLLLAMLMLSAGTGAYVAQARPHEVLLKPHQVRVLLEPRIQGETLPQVVHEAPAGESRSYTLQAGNGRAFDLLAAAEQTPDGLLLVSLRLIDRQSGEVLTSPRVKGGAGMAMRITVAGAEGQPPLLDLGIVARVGPELKH
jgi:beta-lactamase regulating signal transducer with metallopeptidase domain